ncbi:hypothetical protein [Alteribacillus sp. HJP-4]|uniref:hypothetical protein n=1 Tax=Alteribacillus sp. HJP-4 TaxID=2775394 RepID=UPI0035CD364A
MEAFIIALIIGGIISAINKNKQKETGRNTTNAPENQQEQEQELDWKSIFRENKNPGDNTYPQDRRRDQQRPTRPVPEAESELYRNEPEQTKYSEAHDQYKKKSDELKRKKEKAKKKIDNVKGYSLDKDEIGTAGTGAPSSYLQESRYHNVSRNEAVNGIIWSEILGAPRSRKSLAASRNLPVYRRKS